MKFIPLVMAGGVGERFWPVSRKNLPKQFLEVVSPQSMIADTVTRLAAVARPEDIHVATTAAFSDLVRTSVPAMKAANIIVEPALRNTAPCIGLAAFQLGKKYGKDAVIGVFPADHVIRDLAQFRRTIEAAAAVAAEKDLICQIGIKPTFPSTGYGYIQRGGLLDEPDGIAVYKVTAFREKPGPATAEDYVESGDYYWNGGIFIFKPAVMIAEFKRFLPAIHDALAEAADDPARLAELYPGLPKLSIDYGIMEKTDRRCVAEAPFDWDDVGAWDAVAKYFDKDPRGNVIQGAFAGEDCGNCQVFNRSGLTVAGIGLEGLIVVATDDAILICRKDRAQDVKKIVTALRHQGKENVI